MLFLKIFGLLGSGSCVNCVKNIGVKNSNNIMLLNFSVKNKININVKNRVYSRIAYTIFLTQIFKTF